MSNAPSDASKENRVTVKVKSRASYSSMSPAERVSAVGDLTLKRLNKLGVESIPALRRVHRRVRCPWNSDSTAIADRAQ